MALMLCPIIPLSLYKVTVFDQNKGFDVLLLSGHGEMRRTSNEYLSIKIILSYAYVFQTYWRAIHNTAGDLEVVLCFLLFIEFIETFPRMGPTQWNIRKPC